MSLVVQTSTLECKEALLETHPLFQAHIPCCLITLDFNSAVGVMCDFDIIVRVNAMDSVGGLTVCYWTRLQSPVLWVRSYHQDWIIFGFSFYIQNLAKVLVELGILIFRH